jgi:hypothetical protein
MPNQRAKDNIDIQLQAQISELKGIVVTGFDGIDKHLTQLNGQVLDHSKIITKILAKDDYEAGKKVGMTMFWKISGSVILVLAGAAAIVGVILNIKL